MRYKRIGLVAHDAKKPDMVAWVSQHRDYFEGRALYATGTTGAQILAACPEFNLTALKSGPLGGDQQLGAMICQQQLDALFFFTDAMTPMPHDVDVKALIRLSTLYNLPLACNEASASLLLMAMR